MLRGFHLVPEGLVVRVAQDDEVRPFPMPHFRGPGITQAQARDRRELDIVSEYGRMASYRARYLEKHGGKTPEAEPEFQPAEEESQ